MAPSIVLLMDVALSWGGHTICTAAQGPGKGPHCHLKCAFLLSITLHATDLANESPSEGKGPVYCSGPGAL